MSTSATHVPNVPPDVSSSASSRRLVSEPHIKFRDLLKKVGSGTHTSKSLSREEAAIATEMMLKEAATPAQIGAFMIAHRIKRPTPTELAGMLDTYDALGPRLTEIDSRHPVTVFSNPYDGKSRTAPISPLTALVMASADAPVVLHGSGRVPTKHGLPTIEVFEGLGLAWQSLKTLEQVQNVFRQTGLGFLFQPVQFPLAEALVDYREQIGKRPTLATVEIMWAPYIGPSNVVSGYVHPPTEVRTQSAFTERGTKFFTTVKGLEGSCDIARDRTAIISLNQVQAGTLSTERLLLHPRDYGFNGSDPDLTSLEGLRQDYQAAIAGETSEIGRSAVWNSGFYLWRVGRVDSLEAGYEIARSHLKSGIVKDKLHQIKQAIQEQSTP
ncbi:MAG: anthranilate phosphoribosyltransferase family protein [Cyanobacteria bacterium J06626_6]